jgi:zinc transport system ATP-binding protein
MTGRLDADVPPATDNGSPQHAPSSCAAHDHSYDPAAAGPLDKTALFSIRNLRVTRQGRDLLCNVDFDLSSGEIVTVIGPNGAGKTTLVKVLLGLMDEDAGMVYRRPKLKIGYVPQTFGIDSALPLTVERFLPLGLRRKLSKNELSDRLGEVGAAHVLTRQLQDVSGGELQRVLLCRALLRSPDVLVLDEPAQGVDVTGEAELYDLISGLKDRYGISVLMVSHDLHTVMARSNRVICLNHHVCCSGFPEAVSKHPEYERLFGPKAAKSIAVYRHHHDHRHDLSGEPAETSPTDEADK